eukprot:724151_1
MMTTEAETKTLMMSKCDSQHSFPKVTAETRYDVQWLNNNQSVVFDYHRYDLSSYQPKTISKPDEYQLNCSTRGRGCNNYIRVRKMQNKWECTYFAMHNTLKGQEHQQTHHSLITPGTKHIQDIQTCAQQDVLLHGSTARQSCESQMLQNPKLHQLLSVRTLQRKVGKITPKLIDEFPPLPTCRASAAQTLID